MEIYLVNRNGELKRSYFGWSFTSLFFGFFVPLFRGDWKSFFIYFFVDIFTAWLGCVVQMIIYNKSYTANLIKSGFYAQNEIDQNVLKTHGIYVQTITEAGGLAGQPSPSQT